MIDRSALIQGFVHGLARGGVLPRLSAARSRAGHLSRLALDQVKRAVRAAKPTLRRVEMLTKGTLLSVQGLARARVTLGQQAVRLAGRRIQLVGYQEMKAEIIRRLQSVVYSRIWWQNPERIADLAILALAGIIGIALSRIEVGSGDYGQWLMLSRYYLGQDIPDYRQVSSVPPVMPLMLAFTRLVVHDSLAALQVFRCLLSMAFAVSFYLAGAAVFRSRGAGVLAAVCAFMVTDRMLEPFAFGGLPQLCALTFLNLGIAAFGQAAGCTSLRMRWWVLGGLGVTLAVLSHTGTGLIAIAAGVSVAFVSVFRVPRLTWTQRGLAVMPLAALLAALAIYWATIILPVNQEYAQNPASLAYRGPDRIWMLLKAYTPNLVLLVGAAALLAAGCTYEACSRRIGGYMVTAAWALSACAVLVFSVMVGAATDYPRFVPLILAPLAVAAGGGLALTTAQMAGLFRYRFQHVARVAVPVALAAMVALNVGPRTMAQHSEESSFYQTSQLADLAAVASSLNAQLPQGAAVLSTAREGKWIEGLTGREALFAIPTRFSFRLQERARSIAADTLLRSTTSVTNEFLFIKYVDRKSSDTGDVPRQPWISVNHCGEYVDLVRILPTESSVIAADSQGGVLATLNALKAVSAQVVEDGNALELRTAWEGERRGGIVSYTRTLFMEAGSTSFELVDEVSSTTPIQEVQVLIRPVPGMEIVAVEAYDGHVDLYFPATGGCEPCLRVSAVGQPVDFEQAEDGILVRALEDSRLHLQFTVVTAGEPVYELGLFAPNQLVEDYGIEAVVLAESPALEARIARLEYLGFTRQEELGAGPYVVLLRTSNIADLSQA